MVCSARFDSLFAISVWPGKRRALSNSVFDDIAYNVVECARSSPFEIAKLVRGEMTKAQHFHDIAIIKSIFFSLASHWMWPTSNCLVKCCQRYCF